VPAVHRIRQTFTALISRPDDECRQLIERNLTPAQSSAFRRLAAADQAHLCRVFANIETQKSVSPDLKVAALLHDIGKVSDRGRVRLADRIAKVLLANVSPSTLEKLASRPAPRWLEGLSLAVHHPALGAENAAALGCSERTCWLIAHHEDPSPILDKELCLLVAVDRQTV
jgi:hypothetical protein